MKKRRLVTYMHREKCATQKGHPLRGPCGCGGLKKVLYLTTDKETN